MRTLGEVRNRTRARALALRINPRDVDLLLMDALNKPLAFLIGQDDSIVDADVEAEFLQRIERRFAGEPVQYLRGRAEFYGREFLVDSRVLIPRPETELLVEATMARVSHNQSVIDIGTGSGCVAVTLTCERPDLIVRATDISVAALALASTNARRLGAPLRFVASDVFSGIRSKFDVIVSNPPYIAQTEIPGLQQEVRRFEPIDALTPGSDPLAMIRRLISQASTFLNAGGYLLFELGWNQATDVLAAATDSGWKRCDFLNDLAGIPRVAVLCSDP